MIILHEASLCSGKLMLHGQPVMINPTTGYPWAVVYKKWKLSCNKDMSYHELYDAINDPLEKNDLASENAQTVKEMKTLLMDWQKTLPDKPSGNVFSKLRKK